MKARFDDHPEACYNCQGCSRLNKCVVCVEWPDENWDTLAARAERRKRSKDRASVALGAPPTKKGRSSKSPVILPSVSPSTCLKTSYPLPPLPPEEETSRFRLTDFESAFGPGGLVSCSECADGCA